ncbi:MAG: sugar transferase [bacterium]
MSAGGDRKPDVAADTAPGRSRRDARVVPLLLLADFLAVPLAWLLAFALRITVPVPLTLHLLPADRLAMVQEALLVGLVTQFPLLYVFGLYDRGLLRRGREPLMAAALAVFAQLLWISAWYFFRADSQFPRSVVLLFTAFNLALVAGARQLAGQMLLRGREVLRVVLVGPASEIRDLEGILTGPGRHGRRVEIVGAVRSDGPAPPGEKVPGSELCWLGNMRDLERETRAGRIDKVILAPAPSWKDEILEGVLQATKAPQAPGVAVVPSVHELLVGRLTSLSIEDVPLIEVVRDPGSGFGFTIKPVVDMLLASLLLLAVTPVLAVASVAIRVSSRGPIIFRQRRVGEGGSEFMIYKLRTMREGAEDGVGAVLADLDDARVVGVGGFLRSTRIDEIPQLLNVLNGTMSLVGPRPERPELAEKLVREIPGYAERWLVKPGLSGLAQVRGEYHTAPGYKLKYDLAYIHNHSLLLDLRIMAETIRVLLTRRGV